MDEFSRWFEKEFPESCEARNILIALICIVIILAPYLNEMIRQIRLDIMATRWEREFNPKKERGK